MATVYARGKCSHRETNNLVNIWAGGWIVSIGVFINDLYFWIQCNSVVKVFSTMDLVYCKPTLVPHVQSKIFITTRQKACNMCGVLAPDFWDDRMNCNYIYMSASIFICACKHTVLFSEENKLNRIKMRCHCRYFRKCIKATIHYIKHTKFSKLEQWIG